MPSPTKSAPPSLTRPVAVIRHATLPYEQALGMQRQRLDAIQSGSAPDTLYLLEHPHVYTVGKSAPHNEVLSDSLDDKRIPTVETDRGGRVTYHGPGQLIAYVLWNLRPLTRDVRGHVERLESTVMLTLQRIGLHTSRSSRGPGVWINGRKIAALGVRVRGGVTYHGLSINRNPDLTCYQGIIPCGMADAPVTSLDDLGCDLSRTELETLFIESFSEVFHAETFSEQPQSTAGTHKGVDQ
ncbi:MAG: lipoyl(octanoyl) transferase LipB [Magnetococcales bacterium]|nr:lipoyl(octanoyl) transferase LipB [Magnetococcales bacterium]